MPCAKMLKLRSIDMNRNTYLIVGLVLLVFGITVQVYAFQRCGFTQTLMYGKNAVWAAAGGYCDD